MSGRTSVLLIAGLAALFLLSVLMPWRALVDLMAQDRELGLAALAQLRLPRALLALIYGAMLGASGAAIQALFANPLASPDLPGTTRAAALGAGATAYIFGFSHTLALEIGTTPG